MADSDHSMSFACVTRRMALGGGVAAAAGWVLAGDARARNLATATDVAPNSTRDPTVALWQEWQTTHELAERLYRRQQELEDELAERVDYPGTMVAVPGGKPVHVCSMEGLDRVVGARTDMADIRTKAKAELASQQARFEAVAEEMGYFSGLRAERKAEEREESLLKALSVTPATSLAGVVGKLDAVMRRDEAWEDFSKHPWPQIRSARDDLVRLGRQMAGEQFFSGDRTAL